MSFCIRILPHAGVRHWASVEVNSSWAHYFMPTTMNRTDCWAVSFLCRQGNAGVWHWATRIVVKSSLAPLFEFAAFGWAVCWTIWILRYTHIFSWASFRIRSSGTHHFFRTAHNRAEGRTVRIALYAIIFHGATFLIYSTWTLHHIHRTFCWTEGSCRTTCVRIHGHAPKG